MPSSGDGAGRCSACVIAMTDLGQVFWYTSTLALTIDTVSIVVTQFNGSATTSTTTLRANVGTISSLDPKDSILSSHVLSIEENLTGYGPYDPVTNFLLAKGTDGQLNDVSSIPYPLAYLDANALYFALVEGPCSQCSSLTYPFTYDIVTEGGCTTTSTIQYLPIPYNEALPYSNFEMPFEFTFKSDTNAFSAWLASNTYLKDVDTRNLACSLAVGGTGPPVVKIPVQALTSTVSRTVQGTTSPKTQAAAPASPVRSVIAPSTAAPTSSTVPQAVMPAASRPSPPNSESIHTPNPPLKLKSKSTLSQVSAPGPPSHVASVPKPATLSKGKSRSPIAPVAVPTSKRHTVPVLEPTSSLESQTIPKPANLPKDPVAELTRAKPVQAVGSPHHAAKSFVVPLQAAPTAAGADHPSPGLPLAASNYAEEAKPSLGDSKEPLQSDNVNIAPQAPSSRYKAAHHTVAGSTAQDQPPLLSKTLERVQGLHIAGLIYTSQEDSGNYLIKAHTLARGHQMTMSGTPISLAPHGRFAVVGTRTQNIVTSTPHITPTSLRGIAYVGQTGNDQTTPGSSVTPDQKNEKGDSAPVTGTRGLHDFSVGVKSTSSLTQASAPTAVVAFTLNGARYTMNSHSEYVISGQKLSPGEAITLDGQRISYQLPSGSQGIISPTSSSQSDPQPHVESFTFAGSTYIAGHSGKFAVGSQTLSPGGAVSVAGHSIAYGTANGGYIAIESISPLTAQTTKDGSIGRSTTTYPTDSQGDLIIHNQTLAPGEAATISSTPISVGLDPTQNIIIGSSTQTLGPVTAQKDTFTFGPRTYTAGSLGDFVIEGETLIPGEAVTISGMSISYGTINGNFIVVGSSTQSFAPITTMEEMITFSGSTYTQDASSNFVIDGQTLRPGGAITVNGTPISYVMPKMDVIVGTRTEVVMMGSLIMGGFGRGPGGASVTSHMIFTGVAGTSPDSKAPTLGMGNGGATSTGSGTAAGSGPATDSRGSSYREDVLTKGRGLGVLLLLMALLTM